LNSVLTPAQANAMHAIVVRAGGYGVGLLQEMHEAMLDHAPAAALPYACETCGHRHCGRSTYKWIECTRAPKDPLQAGAGS
jgi:hypothetical protein